MNNNTNYSRCPKCGLNYITGGQAECTVCESEGKPYRGKYCRECGGKSGMYEFCGTCYRLAQLSANERRAVGGNGRTGGYRTDNGMLGVRSDKVCEICGTVSPRGRLCRRCYNSIVYSKETEEES